MKIVVLFGCIIALSLGGCSALPSAGPMASEVVAQGQAGNEVLFDVVPVDEHVVATLLAQPKESFHARFEKDANPPELKTAIGDTISVTIWESAAGGLFSPAPPAPPSPGSRPSVEPLAPESPAPAPQTPTPETATPGPTPETETPGGPPSPLNQLFGPPTAPSGPPSETVTPPAGRRPSGANPAEQPLSVVGAAAASGGLGVAIPDQQVAPDGTITVPYAGQVPAAGQTPAEVQQTIEALLASKAIEPQVLVIVRRSAANAVTVAGEVVAGARVPLSSGGDRLLQVIAAAGGIIPSGRITAAGGVAAPTAAGGAPLPAPTGGVTPPAAAGGAALLAVASEVTAPAATSGAAIPASVGSSITAPVYETFVRLSRGGVTATIPFEQLVADPAEDIYARPGDVLTLVRIPQTFSVFGATGRNATITFGAENITLSQALAKSQGLRDDLANPKGVFLFRYEPASIIRALDQPLAAHTEDGLSPVAYRFDLADAKSYFLADEFPVRDKDVIFVADAASAQVQKLFTVLSMVTGPVITGFVTCHASGNC
jgi:polysaccharide biosynthesis/export protein